MRPANHLLGNREENEAFCIAVEDREYAIYFTGKGEVTLNIPQGEYELHWLQIRSSRWGEPKNMEFPSTIKTPSHDQWVVLVRKI